MLNLKYPEPHLGPKMPSILDALLAMNTLLKNKPKGQFKPLGFASLPRTDESHNPMVSVRRSTLTPDSHILNGWHLRS